LIRNLVLQDVVNDLDELARQGIHGLPVGLPLVPFPLIIGPGCGDLPPSEGSSPCGKILLDRGRWIWRRSGILRSRSFIGKLRDELLNGELLDTVMEAKVLVEGWRKDYNRFRPHSSLGYKPPAPEAYVVGKFTQGLVH
jgi:hypothetical protein